jgi:hypothetical protein
LRNINHLLITTCAGITFIDFLYITTPTYISSLSIFIVPVVLSLLFVWSYVVSNANPRINFFKIILAYCMFSAGFVGLLAPLSMLVMWFFSDGLNFQSGQDIYGKAMLIQLGAGCGFAIVGYFGYLRLMKLYART